jgi:glycosyltransferase involved in cell wall biosynthesis
VVVVDDHSTDHSREIIADFGDAVVPVLLDKNMGLPTARNAGIRKARGRYVLHLDSDDYLHTDLIGFEYQFLEHNRDWGAVACDYLLVDEFEHQLSRMSALTHPIACGIMFRKDYLIAIGLYDEKMLVCEDEELRARFERQYTIGHIALPYYRYTRHDGNLTSDYSRVDEYRRRLEQTTAATSAQAPLNDGR